MALGHSAPISAVERDELLGKAAVQEGWNIAFTLRHGHNLYGPGCGAIDDEVSAHRQNRTG